VSTDLSKKFTGVFFPAPLWITKDLTLIEKTILLEIHCLDNEDGCYAGNNHFANLFGRSPWTISTTIAKLKEKGLVSVENFDGRLRTLRITDYGKTQYLLTEKPVGYNNNINNEVNKKENNNIVWRGETPTRTSKHPKHWAMEYWNNLEEPPIPKHQNQNTKSYKEAANHLTRIHCGTFLSNRPKWTRNLVNFFKMRSIPVALLEQPWSREDIFDGLRKLADIYYLDTPRMGLAQMIYNPYTRHDYYSYFFDSFYNHKLLRWRIDNQETEPMEKYVVYIKKTKKQLREEGWSTQEIKEMMQRQELLRSKGLN